MPFAEFWKIYPRRVAKMAAEKAYQQQIKKGYTDAELLAGLRTFNDLIRSRGTDRAYIPHAATWLRAGRWQDDDGRGNGNSGEVLVADNTRNGIDRIPTGLGSIIHRKLGDALFRAYFSECEFTAHAVLAPSVARRDYILNKFQYRMPGLIVEVRNDRLPNSLNSP